MKAAQLNPKILTLGKVANFFQDFFFSRTSSAAYIKKPLQTYLQRAALS